MQSLSLLSNTRGPHSNSSQHYAKGVGCKVLTTQTLFFQKQNLQIIGGGWGRDLWGSGSWQQRLEPPYWPWRPARAVKNISWKGSFPCLKPTACYFMAINPQRIGPQRLRGFRHFAFYFGSNISRQFLRSWCHTDHLEGPCNCIYSNLITAGRASEGRIYQDW